VLSCFKARSDLLLVNTSVGCWLRRSSGVRHHMPYFGNGATKADHGFVLDGSFVGSFTVASGRHIGAESHAAVSDRIDMLK